MTLRPEHDDDDFAVYPFRRQLVAEHTELIAPLPRPAAAQPRPRQAPRRRGPSPFRVAVPLAVIAFLVAVAGAATISHPRQVQQALQDQIVPAAEAAPRPQRRKVARPKLLFVPDVTGLDAKRAARLLKQSRFRPRLRFVKGKPGSVLTQIPKPATEVKKQGVVLLLVGRAKPKAEPIAPHASPTVIVTSVVGLDRNTAVHALLNEGVGVRIFGVHSRQPAGTVVAQAPGSGARAEAGSYVRINVSIG